MLRYMFCGIVFTSVSLTAFVSISLPDWVVTTHKKSLAGDARLGLVRSCVRIAQSERESCYWEEKVPRQWKLALYCIVIGAITELCAGMLCLAKQSQHSLSVARSLGLVSLLFFCCAIISLPAGFQGGAIGGNPFHLPPTCNIGTGYWMLVVLTGVLLLAEMFSACCCPGNNT